MSAVPNLKIDLHDPAFVDDPYPEYRRQLLEHPVYFDPSWGLWFWTRYEDVRWAFSDPRLAAGHVDMIADRAAAATESGLDVADYLKLLGGMMTFLDRRDHISVRGVVTGVMARATETWPEIIERLVADRLAALDGRTEVDLVPEFCRHIPLTVICESLGIPGSVREAYQRWASDYAHLLGVPPPDRWPALANAGNTAARELSALFSQLIADRRKRPGDDLLSQFERAFGDAGMPDEALISMCVNFANAGHFTVIDQLANACYQLLCHGSRRAQLGQDPAAWRAAVDELMRFDPNPQFSIRLARAELEVGGERIPKGAWIAVCLAAANRDPAVFEVPDRLEVSTRRTPHLTFGHGPGYCLGRDLAREQMAAAMQGLWRRFPALALSPERPAIRRWDCLMFRGFASLPVILGGPR